VLAPHKVKAKRVDGGVLIEEGSWSFNSGVYHAQWDILSIPIFDESGQFIDRGSALIPISQVTLLHDWDTIGLRGSGSTSVAVKDVFVPNERIALLSKILQEDYASTHLRDEPLCRLALIPFFATNLVFPALGIAKAALELFLEKAPHRGIAYTWYEKQDEAAITHLQAGEASAKIDAAELMLRRSVDVIEASAVSGTRMALEQRARIRRDAGAASQLIWEAMDLLAGASGGSFAYAKNPMNRLWRDARVAGMHGGLNASTAFRSSGWDSMLVSIWTGSVGLGPVSRILPRLFGRTIPANIDQEPAGALYLASISAAANGTSAWHVCMSSVSRFGSLFQKKVTAPVRGGSGFWYSQTQPIPGWS
jgi:3-hydroxy-9,10-secoandrosta-1,3,5(10)-triene-9,17-dione monooxygenase